MYFDLFYICQAFTFSDVPFQLSSTTASSIEDEINEQKEGEENGSEESDEEEEDDEEKSSNHQQPPVELLRSRGLKLTKQRRGELGEQIIKQCYSEQPNYDNLITALLSNPIFDLPHHMFLTPGIPVAPMLAKPSKSFSEVLTKLSLINFTCEFKYDGERGQIHLLPDGTIKIFSRNSKVFYFC